MRIIASVKLCNHDSMLDYFNISAHILTQNIANEYVNSDLVSLKKSQQK